MDVLAVDALASLVGRGLHEPHSNHTAVPHTNITKHLAHAAAHLANLAAEERATRRLLITWLTLQLAGQVTLPILIGTLLFHKRITRRNPTVINLCIVWTLGTIPSELLFYAKKHVGPKPSLMLCLFQASTVIAVPPMAAVAYLAVVVHACIVIHEWLHRDHVRPFAFDLRMILLLSSPYLTFLGFSLFVAVLGVRHPGEVKRATFFCMVKHRNLSKQILGFSFIVVLMTLIFQLWITYVFFQHWRAKRKGNIKPRDMSAVDIQLLVRMVAFTVFEVVLVVSFISNGINPNLKGARVLLATPPFAVFLIFASSPDILRAWFSCCCARAFKPLPEDSGTTPPKSHMDSLERGDGGFVSQTSREALAKDLDLEKDLPELPMQAVFRAESQWSAATNVAPGKDPARHPIRILRPAATRTKRNQF